MTYLVYCHTPCEDKIPTMTLSEVVLKVSFNAFFTELTRRFPSARIFIWCNRENDVIDVIVKKPEEYPLVMEEIHACNVLGVVEESSDDRRLCLIVHECHCMKEDTIVRHIGKLDLLNVFPNLIENGWFENSIIQGFSK